MGTRRAQLCQFMQDNPLTARELAALMKMKIADVIDDLEHVRRSRGRDFKITPAYCVACDHTFTKRDKLTTPTRCPRCRAQRVEGPWVSLKPVALASAPDAAPSAPLEAHAEPLQERSLERSHDGAAAQRHEPPQDEPS